MGLAVSAVAAASNLALGSNAGEHTDQKDSIKLKYPFSRIQVSQKKKS